jgi:N-acetylneuraminic acid mutarotase
LHSYSQDRRSLPDRTGFGFLEDLSMNFQSRTERKMKPKTKISGYIIRSLACAVFLSVAVIAAASAFNWPNKWHTSALATGGYGSTAISPSQPRALSFAERVAFQRAIEDVYWRHRIWPRNRGENPHPKPSFDAVMSQAQLENKVAGYLRDSLILQDYWQRPITAEQLQAEMDRMARDTKQPEVLHELFEALGNDPFVIAECLARPLLAERLLTQSAGEQVKQTSRPYEQVAAAAGAYSLPSISDDVECTDNTWSATTTANAPEARRHHTAVWTGSEMIVWGGYSFPPRVFNSGGRYNPSTDSWAATSITNAPSARVNHTAVWTGSEMIVWGGGDFGGNSNTGGRYNPITDTWIATNTTSAPDARSSHTAVWTGSEMIVWGGAPYQLRNTGGRYNPITDTWTPTGTMNAPSGRGSYTAVWTGSEMIVWSGYRTNSLNAGGRYNPSTDSWTPTSTTNAPSNRDFHTAVWTGSEMIVWGGGGPSGFLNTGGRYNPSTDSWTTTSTTDAPPARAGHKAVWTGSEMIVWSGFTNFRYRDSGGRYHPSTDSWRATSTTNAPTGRAYHTAVWTGSEMIVWGGSAVGVGLTNTGGRYCAPGLPAQLGNVSTRAFVQTDDDVMIGGFIVQGSEPKRVIIRAIGPELTQYGVPDALANPTLELHDGTGTLIASNDNWRHTIIGGIISRDQVGDIRNSGYAPGDGREAAIIADLPAGRYTAIVRGVNNTTGVALVEVYDLSPSPDSILGNISTRSFVQTGDNVMIGGFIVAGTETKRVIVRAIGPSLTHYGVPNVLADPTLELHDSAGALIASNDNWLHTIIGGIITSDQVREIMATRLAPRGPTESAILADLPAGNYTAIVRGVNNTTGVALVEVYGLGE